MNLDKKIDVFNCVIMDVFQSLYSKSTNKKLDLSNNDINIYKIAMSVYLRLESRQLYMTYRLSSGKDTKKYRSRFRGCIRNCKKRYKINR